MISQDENLAFSASAKTRKTGAILTSLLDATGNSIDGELHNGKKRKRNGNTMEDLLEDPFVVRPYPSTVQVKPRTLEPLVLLPRSHLALSSLEINSTSTALPKSRLFQAHVKILELEDRMGSQPMVLIARLDDNRTLYAVERENRGLYVLCQLGSWVNLKQLRGTAVASKVELLPNTSDTMMQDNETAPLINSEVGKYSKKKRLAIEAIQSMLKRPSISTLTELQSTPKEFQQQLSSHTEKQPLTELLNDGPAQLTAIEIFENVRNQYLEALYSKASLAYFAKGPLSRARAAFHLDYDSTLDMNEYIAFLESLIMTTKLIDRKYSDGIPSCVSLMDVQDHSANDGKHGEGKDKKRKTTKKKRPGKNGLYPLEDNMIRKYWETLEDEAEPGPHGSSREETNKIRITQLRARETQLQMMLILEILALQPLGSTTADVDGLLPTAFSLGGDLQGKEDEVKSKTLEPLTTLIDVHIDRLCIWQDFAAEATNSPPGDPQSGVANRNTSSNFLMHTDNTLRDFCVEVIGPFFSARLPDRCAIINSKLGGPVVISPPKAKLSKSASFSGATSRPGAATKRAVPAKPRPSLHRVLTDERERNRRSAARGPGRSISLMRSATAPIIPGLKREASEAPCLSSISVADSQSLTASRPGVLNSKRFSQREVDLSSLAPEVNCRAKKQLNIEAELKEAISALKKPNRELAGKNIVETAEKRAAGLTRSRKSKKPVQNFLYNGVQISATPRINRWKDVLSRAQTPVLSEMVEEVEVTAISSSSLPLIPQSIARPPLGGLPRDSLQPVFNVTPVGKVVTLTQSSISIPRVPPVKDRGYMPCSPFQSRHSAQLFAAVPDSAVKGASHPGMNRGVQDTPTKKRTETIYGHPSAAGLCSDKENTQLPQKFTRTETRKMITSSQEESIYQSLGWDDAGDVDELS